MQMRKSTLTARRYVREIFQCHEIYCSQVLRRIAQNRYRPQLPGIREEFTDGEEKRERDGALSIACKRAREKKNCHARARFLKRSGDRVSTFPSSLMIGTGRCFSILLPECSFLRPIIVQFSNRARFHKCFLSIFINYDTRRMKKKKENENVVRYPLRSASRFYERAQTLTRLQDATDTDGRSVLHTHTLLCVLEPRVFQSYNRNNRFLHICYRPLPLKLVHSFLRHPSCPGHAKSRTFPVSQGTLLLLLATRFPLENSFQRQKSLRRVPKLLGS